jgi:hypothetical protein
MRESHLLVGVNAVIIRATMSDPFGHPNQKDGIDALSTEV